MAFTTNQGLFELKVMFFGLTNFPATFQAMMNNIFKDKIREGWVSIYMDDILIHIDNDIAKHQEYVHQILQKLEENDLYLKPEKCAFEQQRIKFSGVVLEGRTIQMDPSKIKGVTDWPAPRTVICGEQGHMAKACPKKKYQYSKPRVDGQKTFVNRPKHPDRPQYTRLRYDQPKSDHNQGFRKSNKQGLKFGYYPQGRITSIEEIEEERDKNEGYQEGYQESYEPLSLAARTARLSDNQKEEWLQELDSLDIHF